MLYRTFILDSNILDVFAAEEPEAKELLELINNYNLHHCFLIPHSVVKEIESNATPVLVKRILYGFLHTEPVELNFEELNNLNKLFMNAKGNAKSKNIIPDLRHIAEAAKYGHYFVTLDARLLKRRDNIKKIYPQLSLIKLSEALIIIRQAYEVNKVFN